MAHSVLAPLGRFRTTCCRMGTSTVVSTRLIVGTSTSTIFSTLRQRVPTPSHLQTGPPAADGQNSAIPRLLRPSLVSRPLMPSLWEPSEAALSLARPTKRQHGGSTSQLRGAVVADCYPLIHCVRLVFTRDGRWIIDSSTLSGCCLRPCQGSGRVLESAILPLPIVNPLSLSPFHRGFRPHANPA